MRSQVSKRIKKARSARLLALSQQMEKRFAQSQYGRLSEVLWEQVSGATPEGYIVTGYTDNYMRVRTIHPRDLTNIITTTQLGTYTEGVIHGTVKEIAPQ